MRSTGYTKPFTLKHYALLCCDHRTNILCGMVCSRQHGNVVVAKNGLDSAVGRWNKFAFSPYLHFTFTNNFSKKSIRIISIATGKRPRGYLILSNHHQNAKFIKRTLQFGKGHCQPGGVLRYMGYIVMCGPKGCGFSAVLVINRVSILAILLPFWS